jgi:Tfp pilus assembly protein PilO
MNTLRPFIIIGIAIGLVYLYAWPQWNAIGLLRTRNLELQTALGKAEELAQIRNRLMDQYNAISPTDTEKIARVVPEKYDPVKLVADVNAIGLGYGMIIRDVKLSSVTAAATTGAIQDAPPIEPYVKRQFSFSAVGQYRNFISFITDLETSLQLMDLHKVEVSAAPVGATPKTGTGSQTVPQSGSLEFKVTLYTYWIQ